MDASRVARFVRGSTAGAFATFVALVSHLLGGGEAPAVLGIVLPLLASMWVSIVLAGRRLSFWRLSLSVVLSQVLFHYLFAFGSPSTGVLPSTAHSGHGHSGHGEMPVVPVETGAVRAGVEHLHVAPLMSFWHGVAAVVTIAFLYRGERALQRMGALATQLVTWVRQHLALSPVVVLTCRSKLLRSGTGATVRVRCPELAPLSRRGPPFHYAG